MVKNKARAAFIAALGLLAPLMAVAAAILAAPASPLAAGLAALAALLAFTFALAEQAAQKKLEAGAQIAEAGAKDGGARLAAAQAEVHSLSALLAKAREVPARSEAELAAVTAFEDARMVLPIARRVAAAIPKKTEEATMHLLERFEAVRELSTKAAEASKEAMAHIGGDDKGSGSIQAKATSTKGAIQAQSSAVTSIVANNRENARKLQAMSRELESGIELIQSIEEITERSRLIAFNMAVEAARIGEKGRGFKVIVGELRSLNDRTADFSRQVAALLGRYRDYNATLVAEMAEHSERLSGEVLDVMNVAAEAVESLIESSTTAGGLSVRLANLVTDVDRDLDGVLEALQFQDITRQMQEGSVRLVTEAETCLAHAEPILASMGERDRAATLKRFEAIKKRFIEQAKTTDEKNAIMEVML